MKQKQLHLVLVYALSSIILSVFCIYSVSKIFAQDGTENPDGLTNTTTAPGDEPEPEDTTTHEPDVTMEKPPASDTTTVTVPDDHDGDEPEDTTTHEEPEATTEDDSDTTTTTIAADDHDYIDTKDVDPKNVEEYVTTFIPRTEAVELFSKKRKTELNVQEQELLKKIKEQAARDSDKDGLPDYEEIRIGTDIFSKDSDNDGFSDGDEIKNGFNPLKFSAGDESDKIQYEHPKEEDEISDAYVVTKVEYRQQAWYDVESKTMKDGVEVRGVALPNSFVTLFVYSDPIVVTVQSNNEGNWYYLLKKELDEGDHKVYAAVTDNTGKITTRSEPIAFVKAAKAISGEEIEATQLQTQLVSPMKKAQGDMTKFVLAISIVSLLLATVSVGYFIKHRHHDMRKVENINPNQG